MYNATDWREWIPDLGRSMTAAEKLAGLNNLETQYDEAIAVLNAITHAERYYTKTQADGKYYTPSNDGSGSLLVAYKIDGDTALSILAGGTPSGVVGLWPGSVASIPSGWVLCNGLNNAPDLRDRFIPGAGGIYSRGDFGGFDQVTPTASSVTIATHALTVNELPGHTHTYIDAYNSSGSARGGDGGPEGAPVDHSTLTTDQGTSIAHGHPGSTFSGNPQNNLPQFHALCFIMRQ